MDNRAIGIFDSGLGGLTAASEFSRLLPNEHIIYLGDSYNMPYGEKTPEQIVSMSLMDLKFLLSRNVKAVFVACGTATSNALEAIREESPVPVYGVVAAAVNEAIETTENKRVGVLATRACVESGAFQRLLQEKSPKLQITAKACPKFATMVEYGVFDKHDERVLNAVSEYLPVMKQAGVDTLILGCTHYPLLKEVISEYMGNNVRLISAGGAAARSLCRFLENNGLCADSSNAKTEYFTTGDPNNFSKTAKLMLSRDISNELTGIEPFYFDNRGNL